MQIFQKILIYVSYLQIKADHEPTCHHIRKYYYEHTNSQIIY